MTTDSSSPADLPLPPVIPASKAALFLDFDGTLVPYGGVNLMGTKAAPDLPGLLARLKQKLGGAVAIVSGRGVAELDGLLAPTKLAISGTHGSELRRSPDADTEIVFAAEGLESLNTTLTKWSDAHPGTGIELKPLTSVLHYHSVPELTEEIAHYSKELETLWPDFVAEHGRGTVEFKPNGADKGKGIKALTSLPPFAGRTPIFLGDDLPDEEGFAVINALGGFSVKVGSGETQARYRLQKQADVRDYLEELAAS